MYSEIRNLLMFLGDRTDATKLVDDTLLSLWVAITPDASQESPIAVKVREFRESLLSAQYRHKGKECIMKRLRYEIVNHGVDAPDYFPGIGVVFTPYDHVVIGAGDSFNDALNDAINSMAQNENLSDGVYNAIYEQNKLPEDEDRDTCIEEEENEGNDGKELLYYVGIRYTVFEL